MHWTQNWGWWIYCLLFTLIAIGNTAMTLSRESPLCIYYHVLIAFHPQYIFLYFLALASAFLTLASLLPLFLFVARRPFFGAKLWQWLFVLRTAFEATGHGYEYQVLRSFYYNDPWIVVSLLTLYLSSILPSYYACFQYAFHWEKLFPNQ